MLAQLPALAGCVSRAWRAVWALLPLEVLAVMALSLAGPVCPVVYTVSLDRRKKDEAAWNRHLPFDFRRDAPLPQIVLKDFAAAAAGLHLTHVCTWLSHAVHGGGQLVAVLSWRQRSWGEQGHTD